MPDAIINRTITSEKESMSIKSAQPRLESGFFATSRGFNLSYDFIRCQTTIPNMAVVVLLAAPGFDRNYWLCLMYKICPYVHVYVFNYLGTGRSQRPIDVADYALDLLTIDLAEFVEYIHAANVSLVGHGIGGVLALSYAAYYPSRVNRVVVSATSPYFYSEPGYDAGIQGAVIEQYQGLQSADPCQVHQSATNIVILTDPTDCQDRWMLVDQYIRNRAEISLFLQIARSLDVRPVLAQITAPVCVIYGQCDTFSPPKAAFYLRERIGNAVLMEIAAQGNNFPILATDIYNTAVTTFLFGTCCPCRLYFESIPLTVCNAARKNCAAQIDSTRCKIKIDTRQHQNLKQLNV